MAMLVYPEGNMEHNLGGGFKYFSFSTLSGEMIQFDEYFSDGLKPPTSNSLEVWKMIIFLSFAWDPWLSR